jgi:4'-phosphopantetheinyl transferase
VSSQRSSPAKPARAPGGSTEPTLGHGFVLALPASDVPAGDAWLAPPERVVAARLRREPRRRDWRLGRWVAKQAVAALLGLPGGGPEACEIEVRAAADGAPELLVAGCPVDLAISISHRADVGLCALGDGAGAIGCDLELVEPRSEAMIADFYTRAECDRVLAADGPERERIAALLWSAKESALKVLREGLRRDTRSVEVVLPDAPKEYGRHGRWHPLAVRCHETGRLFPGWWRTLGGLVATVVCARPTAAPLELSAPGSRRIAQGPPAAHTRTEC